MNIATKKAIVLGWYGAGNVGDELLAGQTIKMLSELNYEISLISVDPNFSRRVHEGCNFLRMYDWFGIAREMASADLFVIGGGGIFQEYDHLSVASLYEFPARSITFYAQVCFLARQFAVTSVYLAQGVGPLFTAGAKAIVRDLFQNADVVSVRDEDSARLLQALGVTRQVVVAPDLTWARAADTSLDRRRRADRKIVAVVVRYWAQNEVDWLQGIERGLRLFQDAGWLIRFINFGGSADSKVVSDLAEKFQNSDCEVFDASPLPFEASSLLADSNAAIVMRLHALQLAAQVQVPVVALCYDPKVDAAADWLDLPGSFRVTTRSHATEFEAAATLLLDEETAKAAIIPLARLSALAEGSRRHTEALSEGAHLSAAPKKGWRADSFDWLSAWLAERESGRAEAFRQLKLEANAQQAATIRLEHDLLSKLEAANAEIAAREREILQLKAAGRERIGRELRAAGDKPEPLIHGRSARDIELEGGAQSKAFMVALLPFIWNHMLTKPTGTHFRILDVGPGAAFGSELLASMHQTDFLCYRVTVDLIDIDNTYAELITRYHKSISALLRQDIFSMTDRYDIVICSHVIEHVPEPLAFVRQLQHIATQKVFVLTPFEERVDIIAPGHINRFDHEFTRNFANSEVHLLESIAWGAFLSPRYKMLLLELSGNGRAAS